MTPIRNINLYFAFMLFACFVVMASTDSNAVGKDEVTLYLNNKIIFFTIFDLLLTLILLLAVIMNRGLYIGNQKKFFIFFLTVLFLLVFLGALYGRIGPYKLTSLVGAEVRGLYGFAVITYGTYWLLSRSRLSIDLIINTILLFVILRSMYEMLFLKGEFYFENSLILDMSQLIFLAVLSLMLTSLLLLRRFRISAFYYFCLMSFIVMIAIGFRRTPMVIMIGGIILLSFFLAISNRMSIKTLIGRLILLSFVATGMVFTDTQYFDGKYSERLLSITEFDSVEGTSNFEHLADKNDAILVISNNPIFGAGLGTVIPNRILSSYGDDIPFHNPYFHSWIKLGLMGFIAYLLFIFWSFKNAISFIRIQPSTSELKAICDWGFAASFSLASYLLLAFAMPPFYLDQKIIFMVGTLLGITIYCRKIMVT